MVRIIDVVLAVGFFTPEAVVGQMLPAEPLVEQFCQKMEHQIARSVQPQMSGDLVLILESPVLPVDPLLDTQQSIGRQTLSSLFNRCPKRSRLATYGISSLPSVYRDVLTYRESPEPPLDFFDVWRRSKATRVLYSPPNWWDSFLGRMTERARTPEYDRYLDYEKRYALLIQQGASDVQMRAFTLEWKISGYKEQVEEAQINIEKLAFPYGAAWWTAVKEKYEVNLEFLNGQAFPETFASPSYSSWLNELGWAKTTTALSSNSAVDMEIKLVKIERPWFEPKLFTNRAWRWDKGNSLGSLTISSGPPVFDGTTPLIQQAIVLGRKIRLSGPDSSRFKAAWITPAGDDPAIVGWICESTPQTPNPDPVYHWVSN